LADFPHPPAQQHRRRCYRRCIISDARLEGATATWTDNRVRQQVRLGNRAKSRVVESEWQLEGHLMQRGQIWTACGPVFDLLTQAEIGGRDRGWWVRLEAGSADLGSEWVETTGAGREWRRRRGKERFCGGVGSVGDERRVVGERDRGRLSWVLIPFVFLYFAFLFPFFSFSFLIWVIERCF
jgi:hypothetical protein